MVRADSHAVLFAFAAVAVDDGGLPSDVFGPFAYVVDLRTPRLPTITGISDGGKYNSRQVAPVVADSPWTVHYTWTSDGTQPAVPDATPVDRLTATPLE